VLLCFVSAMHGADSTLEKDHSVSCEKCTNLHSISDEKQKMVRSYMNYQVSSQVNDLDWCVYDTGPSTIQWNCEV